MDPVVVLGAGPVGQSAALLLARWGVPTVLLDKRPGRDGEGSRAICQQRDVLDVWEAVGVGRRVAEEGLTWSRARTYYRDHELFCITLTDPGRSPFPPFVNISQARTEQILDEQVAQTALVDLRWSHEVVGIRQHSGGVAVTCRTPAGQTTLAASYVLACAGARAEQVRRMLGVSFRGRSFDDCFLICDIRAELPGWENERRFYFDPAWNPGRQVLIHPCPHSTFRVDWQVPPDYDLAAEERSGGLDRRISTIVGGQPYELLWHSVYRFHSRCVDQMRVGRVLLAGDCAHLFAPFGARGLNSGVQDVENAAWKLAFVLRGWASESLLDSYDVERLGAARENLEVTAATMRFLVPQTEAERAHRLAVLRGALHDPATRSHVDSGRLAEPFWYLDSPLTTADPARPFPGRPPPGQPPAVVPGVLLPDAPVRWAQRPEAVRLRQLVRDGLFLLTTDDVDPVPLAAAAAATGAPTEAARIGDLDVDGAVAAVLGVAAREAWLVRPDGHLAAVLADPTPPAVQWAARRLLADPAPARAPQPAGASAAAALRTSPIPSSEECS